jgi:hypothetical protein
LHSIYYGIANVYSGVYVHIGLRICEFVSFRAYKLQFVAHLLKFCFNQSIKFANKLMF